MQNRKISLRVIVVVLLIFGVVGFLFFVFSTGLCGYLSAPKVYRFSMAADTDFTEELAFSFSRQAMTQYKPNASILPVSFIDDEGTSCFKYQPGESNKGKTSWIVNENSVSSRYVVNVRKDQHEVVCEIYPVE